MPFSTLHKFAICSTVLLLGTGGIGYNAYRLYEDSELELRCDRIDAKQIRCQTHYLTSQDSPREIFRGEFSQAIFQPCKSAKPGSTTRLLTKQIALQTNAGEVAILDCLGEERAQAYLDQMNYLVNHPQQTSIRVTRHEDWKIVMNLLVLLLSIWWYGVIGFGKVLMQETPETSETSPE